MGEERRFALIVGAQEVIYHFLQRLVGLYVRIYLFRRHPSEERVVVDVHRYVPVKLLDIHLHRVAELAVLREDAFDVAAKVLLNGREHLDSEEFPHDPLLVWRELGSEERRFQCLGATHCTALRRGRGCR